MRVLVVTNMYPTPDRPGYGTFVEEQVESLRQTGIEVDVFTASGSGVKNYLKTIHALRQFLRGRSYDLLHAHYGLSGFVARMQTRFPVVITFHGNDLYGDATVILLSNLAALGATRCIVVADMLKPKLWFRSAVTIPMGVDLSLFRPMSPHEAKKQLGLSHDKKRVAFVANPGAFNKRFDIARNAVRLLREVSLNVELLPVYNVPHYRMPAYMNACDALVLTSMKEASSCVIKEAMACNLPIVSTNVGDVAERIRGVEGCFLCDPTPEDIARKLRIVLEDGQRTKGRREVESLGLQNIARQVIAVYEQILGARNR